MTVFENIFLRNILLTCFKVACLLKKQILEMFIQKYKVYANNCLTKIIFYILVTNVAFVYFFQIF